MIDDNISDVHMVLKDLRKYFMQNMPYMKIFHDSLIS